MSVSQVKKRFSEFESFLKGDKEGLRRLKLLKDDVNVLRTSLAAAEEQRELAEVIKNAARERADVAEAELRSVSLELKSLTQKVANLTREVKSKAESEDSVKVNNTDRDGKATEIKAVIKSLKHVLKTCPLHFKKADVTGKKTYFYNRHEIANGWSHMDLWTLGAAVAVLTGITGQVVIASDQKLDNVKNADGDNAGLAPQAMLWRNPAVKGNKIWGEEAVGTQRTWDSMFREA